MSNSKSRWLVSNPDIKNGKLCIRGTSVTVELVVMIQIALSMFTTFGIFMIQNN